MLQPIKHIKQHNTVVHEVLSKVYVIKDVCKMGGALRQFGLSYKSK